MRNIKKEYKKYVVSYFLIYIIVNMAIIAFNNNLINENTLEILKKVGIDMANDDTIDKALNMFKNTLEEFKKLT